MKTTSSQQGFSLIELALAIGVAAVCLVTIFCLLPAGLETNQNAARRTVAANLLSTVIADLRATPPTSPRGQAATSPQFGIEIPANPAGAVKTTTLFFDNEGLFSASLTANSVYRLIITFVPNGSGARVATLAVLKMTWPAPANPNDPVGSVEMFAGLDRN